MPKSIPHVIAYTYRGRRYLVEFTSPYRLTLSAMVKRFFQVVIDDGRQLAEVLHVQIMIGGEPSLGASDGAFLHQFYGSGKTCRTRKG